MLTILFWNTKGRAVADNVARLAARAPWSDVVFVAESALAPAVLLPKLNAATGSAYREISIARSAVHTYTRLSKGELRRLVDAPHFVIYRLKTASMPVGVLLVGVHLPSKLRRSASHQRKVAEDVVSVIHKREVACGRIDSVVVGDFNMNPFDHGMIEATAFHAVCSRDVAGDLARKVEGRRYKFYYNPSWSLLGDLVAPPAGTYYRRTGDTDCLFFHALDQVLVRPGLMASMPPSPVDVFIEDGVDRFVSPKNIPKGRKGQPFSDHLPLRLRLNL